MKENEMMLLWALDDLVELLKLKNGYEKFIDKNKAEIKDIRRKMKLLDQVIEFKKRKKEER